MNVHDTFPCRFGAKLFLPQHVIESKIPQSPQKLNGRLKRLR